jgi:putative addiction module killer protein
VHGLEFALPLSPLVAIDKPVSHGIHSGMVQIQQTETYAKWFAGLPDRVARARIDIRIRRLSMGNAGDAKPVGEGVSELRVDHGPGYRVYFIQRGDVVIVLLAGGDKSTQDKDIRNAKALAKDLKDE